MQNIKVKITVHQGVRTSICWLHSLTVVCKVPHSRKLSTLLCFVQDIYSVHLLTLFKAPLTLFKALFIHLFDQLISWSKSQPPCILSYTLKFFHQFVSYRMGYPLWWYELVKIITSGKNLICCLSFAAVLLRRNNK